MSSISDKLKIATAILAVTTVIFAAAAGAFLYAATVDNTRANDFATENAKLKSQIDTLNTQVSQKTQQISALTIQISGLNSQIASDKNQIAQLNASLLKLEKANVSAVFLYRWTQPAAPICIIIIGCIGGSPGMATVTSIVWVNFGTTAAHNAVATVTFFDSAGNPLCSPPPILLGINGNILGQTIDGNASLAASCSTPDTANFFASASITSLTWS